MTPSKVFGSLLTLGLLTACVPLAGSSIPGAGGLSLEVRPRITEGAYTTQEEVKRLTAADIEHLTFTIQRMEPDSEPALTQRVPYSDLPMVVRFSNLKANSLYWIEGKAFQSQEETPENLISKPATAAIEVGTDDVVGIGAKAFHLALKDTEFNGKGSELIIVMDGEYVTTDPATLSIAPLDPTE